MSATLNDEIYLALAAVGWADGELSVDEADAIVRTALEAGVEFDDLEKLEAKMRAPLSVTSIDWASISKEDRLFVYAVASWMTRLDGVVGDEETAALAALGEALNIPERPREHADAIAREIAELPEGDRPFRFDVPRLRAVIGERLAASRAAREAQD